jgi:hypothetical protein
MRFFAALRMTTGGTPCRERRAEQSPAPTGLTGVCSALTAMTVGGGDPDAPQMISALTAMNVGGGDPDAPRTIPALTAMNVGATLAVARVPAPTPACALQAGAFILIMFKFSLYLSCLCCFVPL